MEGPETFFSVFLLIGGVFIFILHSFYLHFTQHLNFVPLTFVLPHDLRLLKREWGSGDHTKQKWILKPVSVRKRETACVEPTVLFLSLFQPAAARGIGVRVIHKWNQIPKKRPIVVQKFV